MNVGIPNSVKQFLSIAFTVFMLWLVFRHLGSFEWKDLKLSPESWMSLLVAAVLVFLANAVRAYRWIVILNNRKQYAFKAALSSTFLGLWFNIVSTTGGNVLVKPWHFSVITRSRYWTIFGSCIAERFFDASFTTLFLIISWLYLKGFLDFNFYIAAAIAIWVTLLSLAMLLIRPYHKILFPLQWLLPMKLFRQIKVLLHLLNKGSYFIRNLWIFSKSAFITIIYWGVHMLANYVLFWGLDLPSEITFFSTALIVTCFMSISMAIPAAGAGAGVVNYSVFAVLIMLSKAHHIQWTETIEKQFLLYSILVYFSNLLPEIIVGGYYYLRERSVLFDIRK
jgi:hypothetical protein